MDAEQYCLTFLSLTLS